MAALASAAIEARDLAVTIDGVPILQPLDLRVKPGEWLSVIGPNGAGKSTLLRALAGVSKASGDVRIGEDSLSALSRLRRAQLVAWVPQAPVIPAGMHVLDYVLLGRTPHRHPLAAEGPDDLAIVHDVLSDLDLSRLAARDVSTLSGGERQRAIIARALAQQAPVLLLDEPTSALDLGHQQEVVLLLDRLRSDGHTIISTMHDLTLAGQSADRLVLLTCGEVMAHGSATEVLTEQHLSDYYGADVSVSHIDGNVVVVPRPLRLPHARTIQIRANNARINRVRTDDGEPQ